MATTRRPLERVFSAKSKRVEVGEVDDGVAGGGASAWAWREGDRREARQSWRQRARRPARE
jgi:hypothetical protein